MRLAAQTFVILALLTSPAFAQLWPNEAGPGGDLFGTSSRQFDRLWQAAPQDADLPETRSGLPQPGARAAIPMLDWTPPPPEAPPKRRARRSSAPSRAAAAPAAAPSAVAPPAAAAAPDRQAWERSLGERERELEALRRRLEEDRRRFEAQR